jgi:hypothetical protein
VFNFRSVGRWVATHKLRRADSFFGVCNEPALYILPPSDRAHLLTYSNKRNREDEDLNDDQGLGMERVPGIICIKPLAHFVPSPPCTRESAYVLYPRALSLGRAYDT